MRGMGLGAVLVREPRTSQFSWAVYTYMSIDLLMSKSTATEQNCSATEFQYMHTTDHTHMCM